MVTEYSRQDLGAIRRRRAELGGGSLAMGVNLGSFAISYGLLDAALDVFGPDVQNENRAADWDPYGWLALSCRTEAEWRSEMAQEAHAGRTALARLVERYPDFYGKMHAVRARLETRCQRPLRIGVLDFGECFWVDMGLHATLRTSLDRLTQSSVVGEVAREIFGIRQSPDARGNIVIDSQVADGADVRDSVIVDSTIADAGSVIRRGVIVGGRHRRVHAPDGGAALFCALDELRFDGPSSIALRSCRRIRSPARRRAPYDASSVGRSSLDARERTRSELRRSRVHSPDPRQPALLWRGERYDGRGRTRRV